MNITEAKSWLQGLKTIDNVVVFDVTKSLSPSKGSNGTKLYHILSVLATTAMKELFTKFEQCVAHGIIERNIFSIPIDKETGLVTTDKLFQMVMSQGVIRANTVRTTSIDNDNYNEDVAIIYLRGLEISLNVEFKAKGETYYDKAGNDFTYNNSLLRVAGFNAIVAGNYFKNTASVRQFKKVDELVAQSRAASILTDSEAANLRMQQHMLGSVATPTLVVTPTPQDDVELQNKIAAYDAIFGAGSYVAMPDIDKAEINAMSVEAIDALGKPVGKK